jgi:hypothetical protein
MDNTDIKETDRSVKYSILYAVVATNQNHTRYENLMKSAGFLTLSAVTNDASSSTW